MTIHENAHEVVDQCLAARSRRLARGITRIYDDHLRPTGLRVSQLTVLVAVASGTKRPIDIAQRLDMDKSTVTRTLQVMEANGWLRRDHGAGGQSLHLTSTGVELVSSAMPAWRAATSEVDARLQPDAAIPYLAQSATEATP